MLLTIAQPDLGNLTLEDLLCTKGFNAPPGEH